MASIIQDRATLEIQVRGRFLPLLFTPARLARVNLISKDEAISATIEHIFDRAVSFTLDWVRVAVTPERLSLSTGKPARFDTLIDMLVAQTQIKENKIVAASRIDEIRVVRSSHYSTTHDRAQKPLVSLVKDPEDWPAAAFQDVKRIQFSASPGDSGGRECLLQVGYSPSSWIYLALELLWFSNESEVSESAEQIVSRDNEFIQRFGKLWPQSLQFIENRLSETIQYLAERLEECED